MEFPSHAFYRVDAFVQRPAQPIGQVLSLGGAIMKRELGDHLLNHGSIIPAGNTAVKADGIPNLYS
jgi:hypothetical protein